MDYFEDKTCSFKATFSKFKKVKKRKTIINKNIKRKSLTLNKIKMLISGIKKNEKNWNNWNFLEKFKN